MTDRDTTRWLRNEGDSRAAANGCRFDVLRGAWTVWWIERYLRLYEGEGYAGQPVILHGCHECDHSEFWSIPEWDEAGQAAHIERARLYAECVANGHQVDWQYECHMRLYGWVRHRERWGRECRRFRQGSIWIPKKSKKSPTLAANGMYLMAGDGEQGQKVFLAAKDGDQSRRNAAKHTVEMLYQCPELYDRSNPRGGICTLNKSTLQITHEPSRSVMYPLSSSNAMTQKSKEGLNGSVLVDECFTENTIVSIPGGNITIDKVRPGQIVYNSAGTGVVLSTTRKTTSHLCRLEYSDGTVICCTASHPIFTERAWVKAGELALGSLAYRQQDVQALWGSLSSASVKKQGRQNLRADGEVLERAGVLLAILRQEIEEPDVFGFGEGESLQDAKAHRSQAADSGRQRTASVRASRGVACGIGSGVGGGVRDPHEDTATRENASDVLQGGHRESGAENRHRSRWPIALHDTRTAAGREENGVSGNPRLVNVSRIECASPVTVFNLHVAGHPSYFANGILAHNCHVVDRSFIDIISRAGISRSEPLFLEFSTAGNNPDSYGKERFDYATDVLAGKVTDEELFAAIYAAPQDVTDQQLDSGFDQIAKAANPSWGHTIDPEEIRLDYERSKSTIEKLSLFKMYRLNVWQHSSNPWLRPSDWAKCAAEYTEADLLGRTCFGAFDLSLKWDTTAIGLLFPWEEHDPPHFRLWVYFFLPEQSARKHADKAPWREWEKQGHITLTDGDTTDFPGIRAKINECRDKFDLQTVAYDDRFAETLAQELQDEDGISMVNFGQTPQNFTEPMGLLESDVISGRIEHPNNLCLNWQAGNATKNRKGMLVKPELDDHKKIDGMVALVMARAMAAAGMGPSVYEARGILSLGESPQPEPVTVPPRDEPAQWGGNWGTDDE